MPHAATCSKIRCFLCLKSIDKSLIASQKYVVGSVRSAPWIQSLSGAKSNSVFSLYIETNCIYLYIWIDMPEQIV